MKKIMVVLVFCLLLGCMAAPKEELKEPETPAETQSITASDIYLQPPMGNSLTPEEYYPLRLKAVQEGDYEKVVIVTYADDETFGEELTVSEEDELTKIKTYFQNISMTGTAQISGPSKNLADFAITLKGKAPIYLRIYEEAFAGDKTELMINSAQPLMEMLETINGETRQVAAPPGETPFIHNQAWTDVKPVEPPLPKEKDESLSTGRIVEDLWVEYDDSLMNTLKIANYIKESFTHWREIEDQAQLVGGLIQQSKAYDCFETDAYVCVEQENGDTLYLPQGKPKLRNFAPDVYDLLSVKNVLDKGKQLFGDDFELPKFKNGAFAFGNLQSYDWLEKEQLFAYHKPYEATMQPRYGMLIYNQQEIGDEITVHMLRFRKEYHFDETNQEFHTIVYGQDGYGVEIDEQVDQAVIEQQIIDHKEYFEKWVYTLKKNGDGYQILQATLIDSPYIPEVNADYGVVYRDAENDVQVNLASADAGHFNRWIKNQQVATTMKENVNQNLLSLWVQGYTQFAVVFDTESGEALSQQEVMERLQIDEDKLLQAVQSIEGYSHVSADYLGSSDFIGELQITDLFIDSKGNPALYLLNKLLLFSWEEVR